MRRHADRLRGRRVLQINSTDHGGGVAQILHATVPLYRSLGIDAHWQVLRAPDAFYAITKRIHDGLQGDGRNLTAADWEIYEAVNAEAAEAIDVDEWDLIMVHDPQPAALRKFTKGANLARWVWRCHIDSSRPNPTYRDRMLGYVQPYDAVVFTLPEYVLDGASQTTRFIAPGIDPQDPKNERMSRGEALGIVAGFGIDPERPFIVQVSRFDRWKDPIGVLAAFRAAKPRVPDLQLALVGETANDDADGAKVLEEVRREAEGVPDVHIIADRADDRTVNAFQTASVAVLQKSIREGFGLTVSEALWSGTTVIGGRAGGIVHQIREGTNGFLVDSVDETAARIIELARDPTRADQMGHAGHERVQTDFLLPRMMRDELQLWSTLLPGGRT